MCAAAATEVKEETFTYQAEVGAIICCTSLSKICVRLAARCRHAVYQALADIFDKHATLGLGYSLSVFTMHREACLVGSACRGHPAPQVLHAWVIRTIIGGCFQDGACSCQVDRLMDLIVNSLYSNREVFLRELVSNASDALDKLRFISLTDPDVLKGDDALEIRIRADKDARTITIE